MKRDWRLNIIGIIILSMLMGLTSCGKEITETSEATSENTTETYKEITETTTEVTTVESGETEISEEIQPYTDRDNYVSSKEENANLPESIYTRLSSDFIDHYEAGTSEGYIYPFNTYGTALFGGLCGFVDESGTIVCDGVYDSVRLWGIQTELQYFQSDFWVTRQLNTNLTSDGMERELVSLISIDGSLVLDNNGELYDEAYLDEDYIFCGKYGTDELTVDVFDFHGNAILHSEIASPVDYLYENYLQEKYEEMTCEEMKEELWSKLVFVSLYEEHYGLFKCYGLTAVLDLTTGDIRNVFNSEDVWPCSQLVLCGYFDDNNVLHRNLCDIDGNIVMEDVKNVKNYVPNRYLVRKDDSYLLIDMIGNVISEFTQADAVPEGIVSDGKLYSYEGEDLGLYIETEPEVLTNYPIEAVNSRGNIFVPDDVEKNVQIPEEIEFIESDIYFGTHTVLGAVSDNTYLMFDIDTGDILFVYNVFMDEDGV